MQGLILFAVMIGLAWVLFILPQQRRVRAHQGLVAALAVGDEVMTTAGIYGRIVAIEPDVIHLEVADGVRIRLAKGAIATRTGGAGAAPEPDEPVDDEIVGGDAGGTVDAPLVRERRGVRRRVADETVPDGSPVDSNDG
jgi:preprotein translocase subunit YajC